MQLSKNRKKKFQIFSAFPKPTKNFEYFEKKDEPQRLLVSKTIDCRKWGYLNAQKALCQNTFGKSTC